MGDELQHTKDAAGSKVEHGAGRRVLHAACDRRAALLPYTAVPDAGDNAILRGSYILDLDAPVRPGIFELVGMATEGIAPRVDSSSREAGHIAPLDLGIEELFQPVIAVGVGDRQPSSIARTISTFSCDIARAVSRLAPRLPMRPAPIHFAYLRRQAMFTHCSGLPLPKALFPPPSSTPATRVDAEIEVRHRPVRHQGDLVAPHVDPVVTISIRAVAAQVGDLDVGIGIHHLLAEVDAVRAILESSGFRR